MASTGTFAPTAVSGSLVLTATFFGNPVVGGYDPTNNRITFIRVQPAGDRSQDQVRRRPDRIHSQRPLQRVRGQRGPGEPPRVRLGLRDHHLIYSS